MSSAAVEALPEQQPARLQPPERQAFPSVRLRPSLPHMLAGNGAIFLLLLLYVLGVPWHLIFLLAAASMIAATLQYRRSEQAARSRYVEPRKAELDKEEAADPAALAATEWQRLLTKYEMVHGLAFPSLAAAGLLCLLVFGDVAGRLGEAPWLLRWTAALLVALGLLAALAKLWANANATPAAASACLLRARAREAEGDFKEVDRNDLLIIEQMSRLESLHKRIDAYSIESALLSALSFSAFITVTLAGRTTIADIHELFPMQFEWRPMPALLASLTALDMRTYPVLPADYLSRHLVGLICLCLLMCASTFLGVLVARLHFNDGYREADCRLKTAQCLDDKEDAAFEDGDTDRADSFSRRIDALLQEAEQLHAGLRLTVMHMRWSRHAGLLFFVAALALCGLFFSELVAGLIVVLFVGALLVGYYDHLQRTLLRRRLG
jgi:hypothetical protein